MRRLAALLILALAAPAAAQERTPAQRQIVIDLAYVLGESHALRQACAGDGDQFWRTRMMRLVETEAPDEGFEDRLKGAFNNGFGARRTEFPLCGPEARRAEAYAAQRGRGLAQRLASVRHVVSQPRPDDPQEDAPDSVAEEETSR